MNITPMFKYDLKTQPFRYGITKAIKQIPFFTLFCYLASLVFLLFVQNPKTSIIPILMPLLGTSFVAMPITLIIFGIIDGFLIRFVFNKTLTAPTTSTLEK